MENKSKVPSVVTILALLTFVLGIIDILSAITPAFPDRLAILRPIFPFIVRSAVRLGTALIGLSLIALSGGIGRRKQVAWIVSISTLFISLIFHLIKGLDVEEAIVTTGLLVALIYERKNFTAQPDMPSVLQGIKALLFSFVFTLFYGTFGLYILERGVRGMFTIQKSFTIIFNTFFLVQNPPVFTNPVIAAFFDSIYLIGFISIGFAILMIFRPVIFRFESSDEDRDRVRRLYAKFGKNYVTGIVLLAGKYYFFNSNDSGFIAYKPVGGYAIVLAEPVCSKEDKQKNTLEFMEFCQKHGWLPVFGGVSKEFAETAGSLGLKHFLVGHNAMINLETYSLDGGDKKPLRYSISIMERLGYVFDVKMPPVDEMLLKDLKKTSDFWVGSHRSKEMKFLVGYFDEKYIGRNMVATLTDAHGKNSAFVNFYEYGDHELSIDLMRHRDVPPDAMLCLFTKLILWAKENGYKKLNLGMAVLYGLGGKGSKTEEKALKIIFDRFNSVYNFKGLYIFKSKFQPDWEPMYFVYPSRLNLTGALAALIRAD